MKAASLRGVGVILLLFAAPVLAQEITGNLEGRIQDEAGKPVPFANVTVSGPNLQGTRGVMSTSEGYFGVFKLPAGSYTVNISHVSYQIVTFENVVVPLGKTVSLGKIQLTTRVFEAPKVVVTERRPLIDPTTTTIGSNLIREDFEVLPIERNYRSLPALLPLANESYLGDEVNFAGATGLENRYFVDGVDVTDPFRGTTGMNLPYNFIREIEVRTGAYEAEYRSSLGGIVNVVTRTGGNKFYGQAFGFFANNRFAGDPRYGAYEPATGDFAQYDVGLTVGGPIVRDKLWFFAAYNPTVEREDVQIPGLEFYQDKNVTHIFAGKLSWRISKKANLDLTISGDPNKREGVGITFGSWGIPVALENPDPYLADIETGSVTASLISNYFVSDRVLFEFSLSAIARKDKYQPATSRGMSEALFVDEETGIWSGGYPERFDYLSIQTTAWIHGSLLLGRHRFKAGIEYRNNSLDSDEYAWAFYRYSDTDFYEWITWGEGTVQNRIPSLFVQDSWRIFDKLRFNLGFRWDGQYLIDVNGDVAQKILDQYQPRAGIIFQPGDGRSHKLFGSFGRFYQELATWLSRRVHGNSKTRSMFYDHDPRVDPSGGILVTEGGGIHPEVENLEGQHYDEFTLGYERQIRKHVKLGVTGVYRNLRQGIHSGHDENGDLVYGNPGEGKMSAYPKFTRDYRSLVLTLERWGARSFNFIASYVLSETKGNYPGLFISDFNYPFPNFNGAFGWPENLINGTGLLPNDRTHVLKLCGSYRFGFRLTVGTSFLWANGTPLSTFEGSSKGPFRGLNFAEERGSSGRTPTIWDLGFRVAFDLVSPQRSSWQARLIADVFHLGSERDPVNFDQVKYFGGDDPQSNPNPTYGLATRYQPPTTMRLGLEVSF
jgi:hypothetical protein